MIAIAPPTRAHYDQNVVSLIANGCLPREWPVSVTLLMAYLDSPVRTAERTEVAELRRQLNEVRPEGKGNHTYAACASPKPLCV